MLSSLNALGCRFYCSAFVPHHTRTSYDGSSILYVDCAIRQTLLKSKISIIVWKTGACFSVCAIYWFNIVLSLFDDSSCMCQNVKKWKISGAEKRTKYIDVRFASLSCSTWVPTLLVRRCALLFQLISKVEMPLESWNIYSTEIDI